MWKLAGLPKPCDDHSDGHGWVLDSGTYKIQWYDGDQLPFDIHSDLEQNTQAPIIEEVEYEEVTYGEDLYGMDEMSEDDDYIKMFYKVNMYCMLDHLDILIIRKQNVNTTKPRHMNVYTMINTYH